MPYQQTTLAQLQTRLALSWEGVPYWTAAESIVYLNEALQTWGLLTGRWKRRVTIQTTANTYEFALPATMTYRMRVAFNGYPLSPSSLTDLDNGQPNWRLESTTSGSPIPTRPTLWAPVSLYLIYIWPMDAVGNNALVIDGVSDTPVLVNPGDFVDLSDADQQLILGYALHAASLKKAGPWLQATTPKFKEFLQAAGAENSLITTSQAYRRYLGVDHRELKPLTGAPSSVAALIAGQAGGDSGGG